MNRLVGKVAAITGGASGIGEAAARLFAEEGARAAVTGLTRSMALDHAAEGIRVNAVAPGPILTRFHEGRAESQGKTVDQYREQFGAVTMLKRPGTPREVAHCILFLASDDASYVT